MRGRDWQSEKVRYLIHFDDGGAGPRYFDRALDVGSEVRDGDRTYEVERVERPSALGSLGHAWVRLIEPTG
jgi:hypothetical protein